MKTALRTIDDVADWIEGASVGGRDPATLVGLLFARWTENVAASRDDEIVIGPAAAGDPMIALRLGPMAVIPLQIQEENPHVTADGHLSVFGIEKIADGVWSLTPSFNIPGLIHCFAVVYGVPEGTWKSD